MFDVPVLVVTVSSAPVLISGVSQANQVAFHKPFVSSAFLKDLAILPQQDSEQLQAVTEAAPSDQNQTKTLIPYEPFQLLKPLNLADAAKVLEQAFVDSLDNIPSQSKLSSNEASNSSISSSASEMTDFAATVATTQNQKQLSPTDLQISSATTESENPMSVLPRHALRQCIDVPHDGTNHGTTALHVVLRGNVIGEISHTDNLEQVVRTLQEMLGNEQINPGNISPIVEESQSAIRLSNDVLLRVIHEEEHGNTSIEKQAAWSNEWAAITWSDQLRQAMGAAPLDPGAIQIMLKGLNPSDQKLDGTASWYGPYFHGRLTANGETFDQNALTAAHKSLPFNTVLQVRNLKNNRTVIVRINDRGPYVGKRSLDLSKVAAQCLGSETAGVIPYEAVVLNQS